MGLQTQARLTSQLTPVNGRNRYPDARHSINFSSVYSGREVTCLFLRRWATSLNSSWSSETELGIQQSTVPLHFICPGGTYGPNPSTPSLGSHPGRQGSWPQHPDSLWTTAASWAPLARAQPSFPLPACLRPLPDTRQRAEAQQANDSQMLLNSCKNTVHKWTTWHLGLLVFLPVKRSPQESTLSTFTDRNALWKIIHKHKRLAIQCGAVFPHNFI